jgi:fructose-1,6-bisphosphatase/inositol monophosphatase family enzyme
MSLSRDVAALMRAVADEVMLPRYRTLSASEISEKSPGEVVTCVDREAETRLRDGLDRLGTGARVIGEEACAEHPALLDGAGRGLVWLVDPLDGTANFARGDGPFGMMVALVADGDPVASWMLDPVTGRLCHAERGLGAWIDGRPARIAAPQGRPVAALATQFMAPHERTRVTRAAARFAQEPIPRCAAESYPRLVIGRNQLALFQRILPWDHAAGVLFLTEAGGRATHWDGSPYRVGTSQTGLLAASSSPVWDLAMTALCPTLSTIGQYEAIAA